ncbi:hypothetical protein NUACC21_23210 [Scytonema sp. NUACC21]
MLDEYIAVNDKKNPVVQNISNASFKQLTHIIQQYSIFTKELVFFTESARKKAFEAGWLEVAYELQENIAEELGSGTQGISHYVLLAEGLEEGLNQPMKNINPSSTTLKLLRNLKIVFDREACYVLGATYAIEATAVAELNMIREIIKKMVQGSLPNSLQYFFNMHLNEWEPEHEEDLKKTVAIYLELQDFEQFEAGFRAFMEAIDAWWKDLTIEVAFTQDLRKNELCLEKVH